MDEILNSNSISDVRFRMSKPQGYYAEDVDKFVDEQVCGSLAAYELQVKELQANIYSLEMQVKDQDNELSTLRMQADFSQSNAINEEDSLVAEAVAAQEKLERENAKLREAIKEWEQWAESVEQTLNEQQTIEEPEPQPVAVPEPAVAAEPVVVPEPEPAAAPASTQQTFTPQPIQQPSTLEPSPTITPKIDTPPADKETNEKDKALQDIMLSVESEISEEELRKVLEEVEETKEDDLYMEAKDVKPEDL